MNPAGHDSAEAGSVDPSEDAALAVQLGRARAMVFLLKGICLVLVLTTAALLCALLFLESRIPIAVIGMPPAGLSASPLPDVPLDQPVDGAEDWAIETARRIWGYPPGDWLGRLSAQSRFTDKGWKEFEESDIGSPDGIGEPGSASCSQPLALPSPLGEGVEDGVYVWRFAFPVRLWMEVGAAASSRDVTAEMVVARRPRVDGGLTVVRLSTTSGEPPHLAPVPDQASGTTTPEDEQ